LFYYFFFNTHFIQLFLKKKAFLHDITPELLKTQIRKNQLPFEIPAPKTKILSVFIGTPTSSAFFTPAQAESLAKSLIVFFFFFFMIFFGFIFSIFHRVRNKLKI